MNQDEAGPNRASRLRITYELGDPSSGEISLADLFDPLHEAVVVADRERRILYINPAAEALFGYPLEELLSQTTEVLYANVEDFVQQGEERYNPDGAVTAEAYRVMYRRADGSLFLGQTSGARVRDATGRHWGYIGLARPAMSAEKSIDTLQRLHSITADPSLKHEQRIDAILALGVRHFGLELAIFSRVQGEVYRVERCLDPAGELAIGTLFDLQGTYCVHTLQAASAVGFHHVAQSVIHNHPCYRDFGLEAYIGCPVRVDEGIYGTLNFSSPAPCTPFSPDDLAFMQLLADTVGYEIHKRNLNNLLNRLARTDELTGLPNRRAVMESLRWQVAHSSRTGLPLTVMSLDLDHFKGINDTWGHAAGDEVLRAFARLITAVVREVDICGRVGGEEFILVLPGTGAQGARTVGERLRQRLATTPILLPTGEQVAVTVSGGIVAFRPGETVESVLNRVDLALYSAKQQGRDRLCESPE